MFVVEINGGLGNQMFEYAYGVAMAKRLKTSFYLGYLNGFVLPKYFELNEYRHTGSRLSYYGFKFLQKLKLARKVSMVGEASQDIAAARNWSYNSGFAQSHEYFRSAEEEVRREFTLKTEHRTTFEEKYGQLFREHSIIVVHLRKTDYADFGNESLGGKGLMLPSEFYKKSLSEIAKIEKYQVVFVSDDIEAVKQDFPAQENYHYAQNAMIVDFQLIMHADIAIISNSSFAWWASFLSPAENRKTIAPTYWLGFKVDKEYPKGIMTDHFSWKNVYD